MKRKSLIYLLFVFFISAFPSSLFSQGEATMLFLRIPPSPALNAMGASGVALPNDDPLGFYHNPSQLGHAGKETNLALQLYPSRIDWLPSFGLKDLNFKSTALTLGYGFGEESKFSRLSLGFGYMNGEINYGRNVYVNTAGEPIAEWSSREYYHAVGIGAALDYHLDFNLGLTYKNISSKLFPNVFVEEQFISGKANENAVDIGFLITAPVLKSVTKRSHDSNSFSPYLIVSIGYALTNIGGKVVYAVKSQADPLPRAASVGYAITSGLDLKLGESWLRAVSVDWSSEANDLLIRRKSNEDIAYQGITGDINIWKNVILGKSSNKVENHHGIRFQFLEFVGLSLGRFNGPGWNPVTTEGYSLILRGLLQILNMATGFEGFRHVNFQYSWAQHSTGDALNPLNNTTYKSLTFRSMVFSV